jgi:hypothetical protein
MALNSFSVPSDDVTASLLGVGMTCVVTLLLALGPLERHLNQATKDAQHSCKRKPIVHHGLA